VSVPPSHCARTIAIDGPSASGKSAVGLRAAETLGYLFLDTGTMYRAMTWVALERGVSPGDHDALGRLTVSVDMQVAPGALPDYATIVCDGVDVTAHLRDEAVERHVSAVSKAPGVRSALVDLQRQFAADNAVVMVGRDIGTVVLPDADLKVYLEAPVEVRAERRWKEMAARGATASFDDVLADLRRRDGIDSTRELSPLRKAAGAVVIETGPLGLDEVVARVLELAGC
jgi:cytidylate kinase